MKAKIVDGKAIAADLFRALSERRTAVSGPITLGVVLAGNDPVIESFVRIKKKAAENLDITLVRRELTENTTEAAMDAVRELSQQTDGIIVQLPLPHPIDINAVVAEIPLSKDVDGISSLAGEHSRLTHAPVALAVREILNREGIRVEGRRAVVVGAGRLVGVPVAEYLASEGADVTRYTLSEGSMSDVAEADILVLGAGEPHFIKPEHIKEGVVLIDAGTSESAGVVMGDADPLCAQKASLMTPVPGGVGPIAVSMIFKNILDLVQRPA